MVKHLEPDDNKIYSMLNDFAFQWLFNRLGQEKITMSLINALLQLENEQRIEELELLNPFHPRRLRDQKLTIVDVKARDGRGNWYCIEAQVHQQDAFISRTAFYVAGLYRDQLNAGSGYAVLMPATCIAILNFDLFKQSKQVHEAFEFRNRTGDITLPETMALHYIDLTKFDPDKPRRLKTNFEKWLHVMKLHRIYGIIGTKVPESIASEEHLLMAIQEFQRLNADEKMRRRMADREKEATDLAIIKGAVRKQALAEGEKIGIEKGEKIGVEKGERIAREKAERDRRDLVLRMIDKGFQLEIIVEVTGLKPDEINRLRS